MQLDQITPVILTWNEEPNLRRCLDRLTWANEVLVIDSGSTDSTLAIIAEYSNTRVLVRPFDNHTLQWNFGIDSAKTNWVLSLDADYMLCPGFENELRDLQSESTYDAYRASFRYLIAGQALRASLYPPRAVLFRKDRCHYVPDGHTQRLHIPGGTAKLETQIDHDDRKPLSRWISSQDKYAELESLKLLASVRADLAWPDRLRVTGWMAIPATLLYTLIVKGVVLDGWRGWFYALQRLFAETLLAMRLLQARLEKEDSQLLHKRTAPVRTGTAPDTQNSTPT